jgi:thioredoxin-related protein
MLFKSITYILLFLLLSSTCPSQDNSDKITLRFETNPEFRSKINIFGFYGTEVFLIDSFEIHNNEIVLTQKNYELYDGFYRLQFDSTIYDFIATPGDKITFNFNSNDFGNTLEIKNNPTNTLLIKLKKELFEINRSIQMFQTYDQNDTMYYAVAQEALHQLKIIKNNLIKEYLQKSDSKSFKILADIIREPINDTGEKSCDLFLNNLHLNDSISVRNNIISQKIIDYLAYCNNNELESFKAGVDQLLLSCDNNNFTRQYVLYFLLKLFNTVGPEEVFRYLVEKYYLQDACIDSNKSDNSEINKNINKLLNLLPGNTAPDFAVENLKGKEFKLSEFKIKNKMLLLFWSPECLYCDELLKELPQLKRKFKKNKIDLLLFSIVTEKQEWQIKSEKFFGINTSDLKGWQSNLLDNYSVNKTPFLILITKDRKILKYDFTFEEFKTEFLK